MRNTVATLGLLALGALSLGCGDDDPAASDGDGAGGATGSGGNGTGASGGNGSGASGGNGAAGGDGSQPAALEDMHLSGRFEQSDAAGPRSTWSGTSIGIRISGTGVEVELAGDGGVFFEVLVDGASVGSFETSGGLATYPLADGLADGEHDVTLYRRTEGWTGVVQFRSFTPAAGGGIVPSPSPFAHRLELIGDSITCGYGVLGPNGDCNFTTDTESAYETYAAIAARNTSADAHLVAYSGKGVFQNYGGDKNELMPELWLRTLTGEPAPWDFASWTADAVVINLGTNDFSAPLGAGDFVPAYAALLGAVRERYPQAALFAVTWEHWGADKVRGWPTQWPRAATARRRSCPSTSRRRRASAATTTPARPPTRAWASS
ncbi:MAG: SGNH/GDSL hydrolase family protein [Polyangiaceae bacterium]